MDGRYSALVTLFLLLPLTASGESRFLDDVPDFTQTNVKGESFGNGQQFCAPAAVSNSLVWLDARKVDQKSLVTLLASTGYMDTDLKIGTGTSELLYGVDRYVNERLGGYKTLEYQGWRKHPERYSGDSSVPTLSFMKRGVGGGAAAWINIGWYRVNRFTKEYERIGGHWVTLVGYDFDAQQLIINDPAPRAGQNKSSNRVTYRELTGGTLTGKKFGLPTNARGYLQLGRGLYKHKKADTAIVDGVVLLELNATRNPALASDR